MKLLPHIEISGEDAKRFRKDFEHPPKPNKRLKRILREIVEEKRYNISAPSLYGGAFEN
jgi:hypothetical protein